MKLIKFDEFSWIWLATIALFVACAIVAPGTVRSVAISAMLPFAAILAIVAVGQTIVIQQRGIDLSSASLMGLGGLLAAYFTEAFGSVPLAIFVTLVIGAFCGAINGYLVSKLNISAIVATLATNSLFFGAMFTIAGGRPLLIPASVEAFSHAKVFGFLPNTLLMAFVFIIVVAVIMNKTAIGRTFIAVGANPATAQAAGMRVTLYQVGTYSAAAICFFVAGILYAGFIGSASHNAGAPYLLPGIAAVIVGGTSFVGGRGSVLASGVAALFMSQLDILIAALGAAASVQLLVQATAIILASIMPQIADVFRVFFASPKRNS